MSEDKEKKNITFEKVMSHYFVEESLFLCTLDIFVPSVAARCCSVNFWNKNITQITCGFKSPKAMVVCACLCVRETMPNCDNIVPTEWVDSAVERNEICHISKQPRSSLYCL